MVISPFMGKHDLIVPAFYGLRGNEVLADEEFNCLICCRWRWTTCAIAKITGIKGFFKKVRIVSDEYIMKMLDEV